MSTAIASIKTVSFKLSNEVCDSIKVPRGTVMRMTPENIKEVSLFSIPDDLADFMKVPHGTQMSSSEIEGHYKKFMKDRSLPSSFDELTCSKIDDEDMRKLLNLRYQPRGF